MRIALWLILSIAWGDTLPIAQEDPRASLQIINGTEKIIEVYWIKSDSERISNGQVEPGKDRIIKTTLGHRFEVVSNSNEVRLLPVKFPYKRFASEVFRIFIRKGSKQTDFQSSHRLR